MSLLTKQTSSLLGIGAGSVQDFASGVAMRRKSRRGISREQALASQTAAEGQDARLVDPGDLRPKHDPKKTQGNVLQLDENDKAFIENMRFVEKKIFKGRNELGKNATAKLKEQVEGLLSSASKSSRGGLEDVWGEVYDRIKDAHGRTAPGGLGKLQDAWGRAVEATNKVLNTELDLESYNFNPAGTVKGAIQGKKAERRVAREFSKGGYSAPLNFWENPDYALAPDLTIKKPQPKKPTAQRRNPLAILG